MESPPSQRRLASAAHENLDHARILAMALNLRDGLLWILGCDENRALKAIERSNPGFEGPVVDAASDRRGEVDIGLNAEAQKLSRQNREVDPTLVEVLLFHPDRIRRGMRLAPAVGWRHGHVAKPDSHLLEAVTCERRSTFTGDPPTQAPWHVRRDRAPVGNLMMQIDVDGPEARRVAQGCRASRGRHNHYRPPCEAKIRGP